MDRIDERDFKNKMKKSVVKYWNVTFDAPQPEETAEEAPVEAEEEAQRKAQEIFERLQQEAAADEDEKQAEIEELLKQQEGYNKTTGSFSGKYGEDAHLDAEHTSQVDHILHAKEEKIQELLEEEESKHHDVR